jgi:hypothetical protein
MKVTVVRYRTKAGSTEENETLIKSVFSELAAKSPSGIRYAVLRVGENDFIHVSVVEDPAAPHPLRELAAFRTFQSTATTRCIEPPQSSDAIIVGNYGVFD